MAYDKYEQEMQQRVWGFDAQRWLDGEKELRQWASRNGYRITHFSVEANPDPDDPPRSYPRITIEVAQL